MLLYRKYGVVITLVTLLLLLLGNRSFHDNQTQRIQTIEINRFMAERSQNPTHITEDTSAMQWVKQIDYRGVEEQTQAFFEGSDIHFTGIHIVPLYQDTRILGYYRFAYEQTASISLFWLWNIGVVLMYGLCLLVLCMLHYQVIRPFYKLQEVALSISKGNLNNAIAESKNKVFNRFIWAINMLRDCLLSAKQRNLVLEKEKRTLVASLSHDIKTPVANIRLYAQALGKNLYKSEEAKDRCLVRIYENTGKIEAYIQAVIQSSQQDIIAIQVQVNEVYVKDVMKMISDTQAEKLALYHTSFHCHSDFNKLICLDAEKTMEVLDNLIDNALKYGDGKMIRITARQEDGCIFAVSNSGDGIPEQDQSQLFQSFYRGSNVEQQSGNGLGLYIAKEIMKAQHGDLYFDQEQSLTTFCIRIPFA